jgi:hypothetical protein
VARAIGLTRFPLPEDDDPRETGTEAGLVRAAALIDQLANPDGLRKQTALFRELAETGMAERLGLASAADLGDRFVGFFWERVEPLVGDALRYLALTWEGRQYTANLYAQVFTVEHRRWRHGPAPGRGDASRTAGVSRSSAPAFALGPGVAPSGAASRSTTRPARAFCLARPWTIPASCLGRPEPTLAGRRSPSRAVVPLGSTRTGRPPLLGCRGSPPRPGRSRRARLTRRPRAALTAPPAAAPRPPGAR